MSIESLTVEAATVNKPVPNPIITLKRVFKNGPTEYIDPAPELEPLKALRLYADAYPHFAHATLAPPRQDGDRLVYEIEKPPVETKG